MREFECVKKGWTVPSTYVASVVTPISISTSIKDEFAG